MPSLLKLVLTLLAGAALGLGATWLAVQQGMEFGLVRAGPWLARPALGSNNADPYAQAILSRTAEIPLGLAEGLMFVARTDDDGASLSASCTYVVSGSMPAARVWTLTLDDPHGFLIDNPAERHGFTSREVVRSTGGAVAIIVSPEAHAGNWLPSASAGAGRFELVLRLYDTPLSAAASTLDKAMMPAIRREHCS